MSGPAGWLAKPPPRLGRRLVPHPLRCRGRFDAQKYDLLRLRWRLREYVERARLRLPANRTSVNVADFFEAPWERIVSELATPLLVVGNPPWVTNSALGVLEAGPALEGQFQATCRHGRHDRKEQL